MARPAIGVFEAGDGRHLTVGASEDHFWRRLCEVVDRPEWMADPELATYEQRRRQAGRLRADLDDVFRGRPRAAWLAALEAADVPCGPVNDPREAVEDVNAVAREVVSWIDHPDLGPIAQVRFGALFGAAPLPSRRPAPRLGEDTDSILAELGYSADEMAGLRATAAV